MKPHEPVYPDAPFPVERLVVSGGNMQATAHRNPYNPLHMDWCFGIGFEPLTLGGETYETGLCVEVESNEIRRLEQFAGFSKRDTDRDVNMGSFYLFDHRPSQDTRFRVHAVRGNRLDIEVQVLVDVGDSYVDSKPPLLQIHVRTEVVFGGILVSSYGTQTEPDYEKLMDVARQLFDVSAFGPPVRTEDTYQGKPVLDLKFTPLT